MNTRLRKTLYAIRTENRSPAWDIGQYLLVMAALLWCMLQSTEGLGYDWQWYRVPRYLFTLNEGIFKAGPLLMGLRVTAQITLCAMALSLVIGLVAMLMRQSCSFVARHLGTLYIESIRNTPLLIQLYILYFVFAPVLGMGAFWSAVLALSLFEGAYMSEIFRAGIQSVPKGQWEAAYSLGMTTPATYRKVILPQAIRNVLPPLTNQAISLVKDSALVATISVFDMTMQGQAIIAETFMTFEIWFTIAAIYLAINLSLSFAVRGMERRLRHYA
ncbi:amino acid ABC transporter permease [Desulfovibrio mangrovi]|uniref:amino acid ABC transporter permease n=1 Tax=Desulfovibrio mangrovi TaxID=2976983 RepID=UPI002247F264|nr:amino acid ABC transporter permease [Desulfovibrio mangrovi]UZP65931.1 amino acid ABC transporter permease [Desulfovibrio mangrovi]